MAVRIRMKPMGRTHRHYYRIVAIDGRQPNDGRVIEELGTYDPHVPNPDNGVLTLNTERVKYWQSVGARTSDKVSAILTKFMAKGYDSLTDEELAVTLINADFNNVFKKHTGIDWINKYQIQTIDKLKRTNFDLNFMTSCVRLVY